MDEKFLIALIGFGAAIVGGLIQSVGSWLLAHRQFVRQSRSQDYELFVQSVAEMSQAGHGTNERSKATSKMIEGRAKILLHGSPDVVRALEKQAFHPVLSSDQSYRDFCYLVLAMRRDVGGEDFPYFEELARSTLFAAPTGEGAK